MKLNLGKGGELPLRANTVTQHPKYKHRGRQKSRHLPGALDGLAKIPRVLHAESAAGAKKKKEKRKAAHPSPAHPPKSLSRLQASFLGLARPSAPGFPTASTHNQERIIFKVFNIPAPPCKRSLPKTLLSLLGKITALKRNCRHATSSGFMTKKKRENKTTSRGVGLHSPHADSRLGCKARDWCGAGAGGRPPTRAPGELSGEGGSGGEGSLQASRESKPSRAKPAGPPRSALPGRAAQRPPPRAPASPNTETTPGRAAQPLRGGPGAPRQQKKKKEEYVCVKLDPTVGETWG